MACLHHWGVQCTKLHLNPFIVSPSWDKNCNFVQISIYGDSCTPFTDKGQIWHATADPRYTLTCQISSRSVYSVAFWRRKPPNFAVFWTSAFCGVASWWKSEKVEHGAQLQTFPYPMVLKSFLYSKSFMAKSYELGMVIEDLEHILAPPKLLGV